MIAPEFKILTYSDQPNNGMLQLLCSKLDVTILPVLLPWTGDFFAKSYSVREAVKDMDKNTIVLVCDAHDVLPINNSTNESICKAIIDNFDLTKITFNAEKNCYPDPSIRDRYPENNSIWKFLNAGIYTGTAGNILNFLDLTLPQIRNTMDQYIFSHMFVNYPDMVALDYECKVFQTLFWLSPEDLTVEHGKVTNNLTSAQPLLIHGNGSTDMSKFI